MRIAPLAGAIAACLALTLMAAAPAQAAGLKCGQEGNTKVCTSTDFVNAAKPSIRVTVNGKTSITYKKGKARTATSVTTIKGLPTKGVCRLRAVVRIQGTVSKAPWTKAKCKDLNFQMTIRKAPLFTIDIPKALVPSTVKILNEVKLPGGKIVKSNTLKIKILSTYKAP